MQAARLLSILMLLQAAPRTAPELSARLEVSVRTILRDVDQLSAAGVPVYAERGRGGGFRLRDGWSTTLTGMTEGETQALMLAGLPAAATQLGLGSAAASARTKVIASLPREWRAQASEVAARLHIDPVDWYREEEHAPHLRDVARAVWEGRALDVRYRSWTRTERQRLEPLGLVLKAGTWYAAARRAGKPGALPRIYRVANIEELALGARFRRPRSFDLAAWWRDAAGDFEAKLRQLDAHVRLSPRGLGWARNARLAVALLDRADARGWIEARITLESVEHGARRLLAFAEEVEVVAPDALRAQMRARVAAVAALYSVHSSGPNKPKPARLRA